MRILFLDQSGNLGGAELALLDLAAFYRDRCKVALFQTGPFRDRLEQAQIPVAVLGDRMINVQKQNGFLKSALGSLGALLPLIKAVVQLSNDYDVIYANTQKAFVVAALASLWSKRPLVYHLHDILSREHFSAANLRIAVTLANRCASCVIANSQASKAAFIQAGGDAQKVQVVYNGFDAKKYVCSEAEQQEMRRLLKLRDEQFVVGHFSRLSPWKGQHVLIEALQQCPENVVALLVGDALFGEEDYAKSLHQQVKALNLGDRVQFLGFRSDIPQLMGACDVVAHTSTAPEPFGRVIVEAMLCGKPAIAAAAGGAVELVHDGEDGWLVTPGDDKKLADCLNRLARDREGVKSMGKQAKTYAEQRFSLENTVAQIRQSLTMLSPIGVTHCLDNTTHAKQ